MAEHLAAQLQALEAVVAAQRALVSATAPGEITTALVRLVEELGGEVVPAHLDGEAAVPVDLTLGWAPALVPAAAPGTPARQRIEVVIPDIVEQARRVLQLVQAAGHGRRLDELDLMTGLPRRAHLLDVGRRAVAGADRYVGFAVADPAQVIDQHGRARLDALVQTLARVVAARCHAADHLGRLAGPGVGVLIVRADPVHLRDLTDDVTEAWAAADTSGTRLLTAEVVARDDAEDSLHRLETELALAAIPHVDVVRKVER